MINGATSQVSSKQNWYYFETEYLVDGDTRTIWTSEAAKQDGAYIDLAFQDPFTATAMSLLTYRQSFTWPSPSKRAELDMGDMKNIAQVSLNGKSAGLLWKPPCCLDVSSLVKPGENETTLDNPTTQRGRAVENVGERSPQTGAFRLDNQQ